LFVVIICTHIYIRACIGVKIGDIERARASLFLSVSRSTNTKKTRKRRKIVRENSGKQHLLITLFNCACDDDDEDDDDDETG
jgi:hypothetical protein